MQYNVLGPLQRDLRELLSSGNNSDLKLRVKGLSRDFEVHSPIIAARCKALRPQVISILKSRKSSSVPAEVAELQISNNVSESSMSEFLRYIYTGEVSFRKSNVYDLCLLSIILQVPSLKKFVSLYLERIENIHHIGINLDKALTDTQENKDMISSLSDLFSDHCSLILRSNSLKERSIPFLQHVLKQENLNVSEREIWNALVAWSCYQCNITPTKAVSGMSTAERKDIGSFIAPFCQPGYLRLLNFDPKFFLTEIEPLSVFSKEEILLKYRFDATAGMMDFHETYPGDRYSFLSRIRQQKITVESSTHPHPRGAHEEMKIEMPKWVSEMEVNFDERTSLGRYSYLEFHADAGKTERIFYLKANPIPKYDGSKWPLSSADASHDDSSLRIEGNVFWFSFYSPQNVGDLAWGYKFTASVVR